MPIFKMSMDSDYTATVNNVEEVYYKLPPQVIKTLKADPNIGAIKISVEAPDLATRLEGVYDCTFGAYFFVDMHNVFHKFKSSITTNHQNWLTSLGTVDNKIWKKRVLADLKDLSIKKEYTDKSADNQLELILTTLKTEFKEKDSVHDPEKLFRDSLKRKGYTGDIHNNADVCEYFKTVIGLDEDESLKYEDLITYVQAFIQWDELIVFPEREKGIFEEVHESGDGFIQRLENYQERMSIAVQFLIGTANIVLKRKGKTTSDFGRKIQNDSMIDTLKDKIASEMENDQSQILARMNTLLEKQEILTKIINRLTSIRSEDTANFEYENSDLKEKSKSIETQIGIIKVEQEEINKQIQEINTKIEKNPEKINFFETLLAGLAKIIPRLKMFMDVDKINNKIKFNKTLETDKIEWNKKLETNKIKLKNLNDDFRKKTVELVKINSKIYRNEKDIDYIKTSGEELQRTKSEKSQIENEVKKLTQQRDNSSSKESVISRFPDIVIEWLNDNKDPLGITSEITQEDVKDIKNIFSGNFRTIKGSPHFDEFLIRQEGENPLWQNIGGRIATDIRNVWRVGFGEKDIKKPSAIDSKRYITKEALSNFGRSSDDNESVVSFRSVLQNASKHRIKINVNTALNTLLKGAIEQKNISEIDRILGIDFSKKEFSEFQIDATNTKDIFDLIESSLNHNRNDKLIDKLILLKGIKDSSDKDQNSTLAKYAVKKGDTDLASKLKYRIVSITDDLIDIAVKNDKIDVLGELMSKNELNDQLVNRAKTYLEQNNFTDFDVIKKKIMKTVSKERLLNQLLSSVCKIGEVGGMT